jgi:hypothetical protein
MCHPSPENLHHELAPSSRQRCGQAVQVGVDPPVLTKADVRRSRTLFNRRDRR